MRHGFRLALFVVLIYVPFLALCLAVGWLSARGILPSDPPRQWLLFPVAGIVAALYLILYLAKRQLRKRFLSRPAPAFDRWFAQHYNPDEASAACAQLILTQVAEGIGGGVQATQVLPSDRLDEDFTYRLWGTAIDSGDLLYHPLEDLVPELSEWFRQQTGRDLEFEPAWHTIADLIRGVSRQLDQR